MTFYNTLESIKEYFVSFRKLETYLSLDLKFPDTWSMPKSTTTDYQVVPFELNHQGSLGMSFVCEMNEV